MSGLIGSLFGSCASNVIANKAKKKTLSKNTLSLLFSHSPFPLSPFPPIFPIPPPVWECSWPAAVGLRPATRAASRAACVPTPQPRVWVTPFSSSSLPSPLGSCSTQPSGRISGRYAYHRKTPKQRERERESEMGIRNSFVLHITFSLSLSFALSIISMTQYAYHQNAHPTPYLERRGRKSFLWERRKMKLSFMHTYLTLFFSFLPALAFSFMAYKRISIRSRYGLLSVFLS